MFLAILVRACLAKREGKEREREDDLPSLVIKITSCLSTSIIYDAVMKDPFRVVCELPGGMIEPPSHFLKGEQEKDSSIKSR